MTLALDNTGILPANLVSAETHTSSEIANNFGLIYPNQGPLYQGGKILQYTPAGWTGSPFTLVEGIDYKLVYILPNIFVSGTPASSQPGLVDEEFNLGTGFNAGSTSITLANTYASLADIEVHFDGIFQGIDQLKSLVGKVLTFATPIPSGVNVIYVNGLTSANPAGSSNQAYGAISLFDSSLNGTFNLTYQALGGSWVYDVMAIEQQIEQVYFNPVSQQIALVPNPVYYKNYSGISLTSYAAIASSLAQVSPIHLSLAYVPRSN